MKIDSTNRLILIIFGALCMITSMVIPNDKNTEIKILGNMFNFSVLIFLIGFTSLLLSMDSLRSFFKIVNKDKSKNDKDYGGY